jgi:hypothetical protein
MNQGFCQERAASSEHSQTNKGNSHCDYRDCSSPFIGAITKYLGMDTL